MVDIKSGKNKCRYCLTISDNTTNVCNYCNSIIEIEMKKQKENEKWIEFKIDENEDYQSWIGKNALIIRELYNSDIVRIKNGIFVIQKMKLNLLFDSHLIKY